MKHIKALVALMISLFLLSNTAQGSVMIAPTRAVLTDKNRSKELTLINSSDEPQTFRISIVNMRLLPDGKMEEILSPDENAPFANALVRFSPRQITLEPHSNQAVRVQARIPAGLPEGEYRCVMKFSQVPNETITKPEIDTKEISISITALTAISIPVIVRHGNLSATAGISCEAKKDMSALNCKITREGTASIYGNLTAKYIPLSGKGSVVALMNGLAVYVGLDRRDIALPIVLPPTVNLSTGKLEIVFTDSPSNKVLASANVSIP